MYINRIMFLGFLMSKQVSLNKDEFKRVGQVVIIATIFYYVEEYEIFFKRTVRP